MLTTSDVLNLLSHYDLGKVRDITSAYRGAVNETAFVHTSQGRFVVRRAHWRLSGTHHRYRHRLIAHLHGCDFPTPPVLPARSGETLVEIGNRFYEIMPFVRGKDYDPARPQQVSSVGATLAWYHTLMQRMPEPPGAKGLRYSPETMLALIEELLERDVMGDLTGILSWYDRRIARLRRKLPTETYQALRHVVIHGDVHSDNVLFADDKVVALLDYDQIAWDIPLADLVDALVAFATAPDPEAYAWGVFRGPLDVERAERLVTAYTQTTPLTFGELSLLPVLLETHWLHEELGRVISTPEGAPDYHQSVLDQGKQLSEWLQEHIDTLMHSWQQYAVEFQMPAPTRWPVSEDLVAIYDT